VAFPAWLGAFLASFVVGSLAEYWGHRVMHVWFKRARHVEHHQNAESHGFLRELWGYLRGSWPLFLLGFAISKQAGIGFAVGGVAYAVFAAYAHELQHAHPECCFWMSRPLHALHHSEALWYQNFGITCDVWDRLFGTYRRSDYQHGAARRWGNLFRIKWR